MSLFAISGPVSASIRCRAIRLRGGWIDHEQPPTRHQHAMGLSNGHRTLVGIDVMHRQSRGHYVNALVSEGERFGGVHGIPDRRRRGARSVRDHVLGWIDTGHQPTGADTSRERSGERPGAAAEVDRVLAGRRVGEGREAGVDPVPATEGDQSGEPVVAPRVRHHPVPVVLTTATRYAVRRPRAVRAASVRVASSVVTSAMGVAHRATVLEDRRQDAHAGSRSVSVCLSICV